MPHIKKPFMKEGALCYKCGKQISFGTYNWSYNTHSKGVFAHVDCRNAVDTVQNTTPQIPTRPQITCAACGNVKGACKCTAVLSTPHTSADITTKIKLAGKHKVTSWIRTILANRRYPFLYGAPGGGKTHLVQSLASDMELPFLVVTCAQDMLKSELLGNKSPLSGMYFESKFRELWEHGGVILFDECGLAPGSFLNVLNSAMEQKIIDFPDGKQIRMHKNCFMLFADNSTLYGTDPIFPERGDVGGAFRDRLTYVKFEYDHAIELLVLALRFDGDVVSASGWHKKVLALRRELSYVQIPVFASSRFAYNSALWLKAGVEMSLILEGELLRGVPEDVINLAKPAIQRALGVSL